MEAPHDSSAETQSNQVADAPLNDSDAKESELQQSNQGYDSDSDSSDSTESELQQSNAGSDTDSDSTVSRKRKAFFAEVADLASEFNVPIAVVVSSSRDPSKFYGLGNPSVEKISDALQSANCDDGEFKIDEQQLKSLQDEVNKLKTEVKKEKGNWWEQDIEHMGLDELVEFGKRINELKNDVQNQMAAKANIGDDQTSKNEDIHGVKD